MEIRDTRVVSIFIVPHIQISIGVFFFIALLYGFREAILFAGILLGISFGANIWCRMSPFRIVCDLSVDRRRVFPGEKLELRIQASNAKFLPVLLRIGVQWNRFMTGRDHEAVGFSKEFGLLWYQTLSFKKVLVPQRRGLYRLGAASLAVGDLFGFYTREIKTRAHMDIVVYPRLVEIKHASLPRRDFHGIPSARSPIEDPVYIYGTRDYQPGSPARRIHWKASARYNRMQEKLYEPAEQEKILILLDVGQIPEGQAGGEFERIVEAAASYAVWLDQLGHAVGFATNGTMAGGGSLIIPISRSPVHLSLILEAFARVTTEPQGRLTDILSQGYPLPWGVSCLAFVYDQEDATAAIKAYLRNRNVPTVLVRAQKTPGFHDDQYKDGAMCFGMDELTFRGDS